MSYQLLVKDILFYQRFLKSAGFYAGSLDGIWGPKSNKADADFVAQSNSIAEQFGVFDKRSESNIITLVPKAQIEARKFLKITRDNNKDVRIISGTRTYEEQDALYSQGRNGNTSQKVTNARGGQSNHNFGIAWDIGLFDSDGSYNTNDTAYKSLAEIILSDIPTIEWGGHWKSFPDFPHYQLKAVSESTAAIRQLFENGEVYV
jgi:peptidoglycan L-alanyl-D-glutamate endopeptidase CwlK